MRGAEGKPNVLAHAVHEVDLITVVVHNLCDNCIASQPDDGQGEVRTEVEIGIDGGEVQSAARNLARGFLFRTLSCEYVCAVEHRKWDTRFCVSTGSMDSLYIAEVRVRTLSKRFR